MPRILIVDDEETLRNALEHWFRAQGFVVDVAGDGLESIDMVKANRYNVVLMDLVMPRMGGREAIEIIKKMDPDLPILVLTGFSDETSGALEAGASKVLIKPLRLEDLEATVRTEMRGDS